MDADILRFLKKHGEQLDAQIAAALELPMDQVEREIAQLALAREIICCKLTRYVRGSKVEGVSCRVSCDGPPTARGPKAGRSKARPAADPDLPKSRQPWQPFVDYETRFELASTRGRNFEAG